MNCDTASSSLPLLAKGPLQKALSVSNTVPFGRLPPPSCWSLIPRPAPGIATISNRGCSSQRNSELLGAVIVSKVSLTLSVIETATSIAASTMLVVLCR
eukprot:scaffold10532_cov449-Chaetoceros_neogracile.AAC.5